MIDDQDVTGAFTLGKRGGTALRVIERARPHPLPGKGVALAGASGAGKSAPTRLARHNDRIDAGSIRRVVPRLSRIENVAEPLPTPGAPGGDEGRALARQAVVTTFGPDRTAA